MRYYLELYGEYFRQALKTLVAYRGDFGIMVGSTLIREGCTLLFIAVIFGKIALLEGWSFYEVVLIYGLSTVAGGVNGVFLNMPHSLGWYVRGGQLDVLLIHPPRPLFQALGANCFNPMALGSLVAGIGITAVALARIDRPFQPWWLAYIPLITVGGSLIMFSLIMIVACLGFWLTNVTSINILLGYVPEFARYPLSIFSSPIRFTMTWLLPFAMAGVLPAGFMLGKDGYQLYGLVAPLIGWVFLALALAFWSFAVRFYVSTGT